jgi:hypothetical protein
MSRLYEKNIMRRDATLSRLPNGENEMAQMPQLIRREIIHLHKAGAQTVANDVAAYEFQSHGRIVEVETYLGNIGGTSGSTSVDGKLNGASIFSTVPSIAFNAATKRRRDSSTTATGASGGSANNVLTPAAGEPFGVRFHPGDYYRVDVTTIPGAASADLSVFLHVVLEDV